MQPRLIKCPQVKAEGTCLGFAYDTQLINKDGVCIHFWLRSTPTNIARETAGNLLREARNARDIVGCTYSDGDPLGYWAHENI